MPTCSQCGAHVDEKTVMQCWQDCLITDHHGICCDCFDTNNGMKPPIKLGSPTQLDWNLYDQFPEIPR